MRPAFIFAVIIDQMRVAGSYHSAEDKKRPESSTPPKQYTRPVAGSTAVDTLLRVGDLITLVFVIDYTILVEPANPESRSSHLLVRISPHVTGDAARDGLAGALDPPTNNH